MSQLFVPPEYYQSSNVISQLGDICRKLGKRAVLIGGKTALQVTKQKISDSLARSQVEIVDLLLYGEECTWDNVNKLTQKVSELKADLIVSIGGGKSLDTGKAAAYKSELPIVTVPTIAGTCAAFTPLSIIHTPQGSHLISSPESALPAAIFVDTDIIAKAPSRLLCSGMGDTLAKWYELRAIASAIPRTSLNTGALALGHACLEIITEFGSKAIISVDKKEVSEALEQVVEAIIWLAGISSILGGEKCRGAAAHAVYSGLTNIKEAHKMYHGELVGFGNLCLIEMEGRPEKEITQAIKLANSINVPITFKQIGTLTEEDIKLAARAATNSRAMGFMPIKIDEEMTLKAMYAIDKKGRKFLET